ncbi:MAG: tetratricopeptide repeat protein [Candidatus Omnitrophota bacterium]
MKASVNNRLIQKVLSILAITSLGLGVYVSVVHYPFLGDDLETIARNPSIRNLAAPEAFARISTPPSRLMVFLSFAFNYQLNRLDAAGYHVFNIILHVVNALLVWQLVRLIFKVPKIYLDDLAAHKNWIALFSALIFLMHPVQTQAVTYISGRTTPLAAFFYLASLCFYMKGRQKESGGKRFLILAAIMAVIGMFTHPVMMTLPIMIILMELIFFKSEKTLMGAEKDFKIQYLLLILCFTLIIPAFYRFGYEEILGRKLTSVSHDLTEETVTGLNYLITQPRVLVTYLKTIFFPVYLNFDYDFRLSKSLIDIPVLTSLAVLFLTVFVAVRFYSASILLFFGIIWFYLTLSVESTLIPLPNVISEHRLYLPLVGLSLGGVACLFNFSKRYTLNKVVLGIVVVLLGGLTMQRNTVYRSGVALWSDVIRKAPEKVRAYNNLGLAYLGEGKIDEAVKNFEKAVSLNPQYAKAYFNRGRIDQQRGDGPRALELFEKALSIDADNPVYLNGRGEIYLSGGMLDKAFADFNGAIERNRNFAEAYNNRGNVYRIKGEWFLALADFTKAIIINPYFEEAYNNRGLIYRTQRKYTEAVSEFTFLLAINPANVAALNNRGLTYRDQKLYDQALRDFNQALQLGPYQDRILNNRGIVYEKTGRPDLALKDYSQAISLNKNYVHAYLNRGFIYLTNNNQDLAFADFNRAVEIGDAPGVSYYYRSLAHFTSRQYLKAKKDLKQAREHGYKPNEFFINILNSALRESH